MRMFALAAVFLAAVPGLWAGPVTLLFDDVETLDTVIMPPGYGGLQWDNVWVLRGEFTANSGYERGTVSAHNVAVNPRGEAGSFSHASGTFTLQSLYATAAWREGLEATFTGFLGASQVHQTTVLLSTLSPSFLQLNWSGINRVVFSGTGGVDNPEDIGVGTHIALDNITFSEFPVSDIPEPGTLGLLGGGLSLAGLYLEFRKRSGTGPAVRGPSQGTGE